FTTSATTYIYPLSLHDALPISVEGRVFMLMLGDGGIAVGEKRCPGAGGTARRAGAQRFVMRLAQTASFSNGREQAGERIRIGWSAGYLFKDRERTRRRVQPGRNTEYLPKAS